MLLKANVLLIPPGWTGTGPHVLHTPHSGAAAHDPKVDSILKGKQSFNGRS